MACFTVKPEVQWLHYELKALFSLGKFLASQIKFSEKSDLMRYLVDDYQEIACFRVSRKQHSNCLSLEDENATIAGPV